MCRVESDLKNILNIDKIICLTDSEVVLNWIQRTDKEYKQFVQNRELEIRRQVPIESWYQVKGEDNLADLPSRGCLPTQLALNEKWIDR